MSIQALTWVIYGVASDIKHADFRTLLVLAGRCEDGGHVCDGHVVHAAASCSNNCSANTLSGTFAS